jgi:hypothetical protein
MRAGVHPIILSAARNLARRFSARATKEATSRAAELLYFGSYRLGLRAEDRARSFAALRMTEGAYIRSTPNLPPAGIGALSDAAIPSARAARVSTGSITPSSQSRALE